MCQLLRVSQASSLMVAALGQNHLEHANVLTRQLLRVRFPEPNELQRPTA